MVWNEYKAEADLHTDECLSDSDSDSSVCAPRPLGYQDWCEWYSNDLYNMWNHLQFYRRDCGMQYYIGSGLQYDDFCQFMYRNSRKITSPLPS